MTWLGFAAFCALLILAIFVGRGLGSHSRKERACACLLALLVASVALQHHPRLAARLLPMELYAPLQPWLSIVAALAFLSAACTALDAPRKRRATAVLAGLLALLAVERSARTAALDAADFSGRPHPTSGVCPQTSGFTCGPAAAATLLGALGLSSSEGRLFERCSTNALLGTCELGLVVGLERELQGSGLRPELLVVGNDELPPRGRPALLVVEHGVFVDHWIVVFDVVGDDVILGDPLIERSQPGLGRQRISRRELARMSRGTWIVLRGEPDEQRLHGPGLAARARSGAGLRP